MSGPYHFIVIDDDRYSNMICNSVVKKFIDAETITLFTSAPEAMEYIKNTYTDQPKDLKTVVLLDINMPVMNGWEFLDEFDKFSDDFKSQFKIYMLSSSIDNKDINRAKNNRNVWDYISKPLTVEKALARFC